MAIPGESFGRTLIDWIKCAQMCSVIAKQQWTEISHRKHRIFYHELFSLCIWRQRNHALLLSSNPRWRAQNRVTIAWAYVSQHVTKIRWQGQRSVALQEQPNCIHHSAMVWDVEVFAGAMLRFSCAESPIREYDGALHKEFEGSGPEDVEVRWYSNMEQYIIYIYIYMYIYIYIYIYIYMYK